ncbi:MAG: hypothetical protein ABIP54_00350 [Candidatus Andersenbacteria bacterium]
MKPANISLIMGLTIPVLMIIGIALAIVIPAQSINPQTDFIYALGQYPSAVQIENGAEVQHSYSIKDNQIKDATLVISQKQDLAPYPYSDQAPVFYMHHTADNSNTEISFHDLGKLKLSDESVSPDGFTMSYGTSSGGMFPFFFEGQNDSATAYLAKGTGSKKVSIVTKGNRPQFSFVAWVIK